MIRLALLPLCLALAVQAAPSRAAEPEALETYLESVRTAHGLPAVAAAFVKGGEIVAIGATGVRALGRPETVTREDRFHLGSNTKAMTATIAGSLVEEGQISWDTTLGSVLGGEIEGLNEGLAAVTLAELLSHTSGIPSDNEAIIKVYENLELFDGNPDAQRLEAVREWKDEVPKVPEGSPFQYANLGYMTAAAMLEHAAGKPWEEMIHERVFEPLGLATAGLGQQATTGRYDAPVGHALDSTGKASPRFWGSAADLPAALGPAGEGHMSVGDYAKWAGWNAGGGKRGPQLVSAETLALLHEPHVEMPAFKNPIPGTPTGGAYGYGWGTLDFDFTDGPVLTHNGSNSMNFAMIVVDPKNDLAAVALTNYPGRTAEEAMLDVVKHLWTTYGTGN